MILDALVKNSGIILMGAGTCLAGVSAWAMRPSQQEAWSETTL